MEDTINRLMGILNKYSTKELNAIYRDKEVDLEIAVFNSIKQAISKPKIHDIHRTEMREAKIEIGIHDDEFYTIHES